MLVWQTVWMVCGQTRGKSIGKRWQNHWQTIVFIEECARSMLERDRKSVHAEAEKLDAIWQTRAQIEGRFCWDLWSWLRRILCKCDTNLLEHVLGSHISANESTGASANDGADASANEAKSGKLGALFYFTTHPKGIRRFRLRTKDNTKSRFLLWWCRSLCRKRS